MLDSDHLADRSPADCRVFGHGRDEPGTHVYDCRAASYLEFNPRPFTSFGNLVLFSASDYSGWTSLWVSNGTAAGTKPLAVAGAGKSGLAPDELTAVGGEALFSGTDSSGQVGLWATNGTAAGTHELLGTFSLPGPTPFVREFLLPKTSQCLADKALFSGGLVVLWITDGTKAGTKELIPSVLS